MSFPYYRELPCRVTVVPGIQGKGFRMIPEQRETRETNPRTRLLYPMSEAAAQLGGITERKLWKMIANGEIDSVKIGRRRMIAADALDAYVQKLQGAAA